VLLRALEPTVGLDRMAARRGLDDLRLLCSGPGRLCQALGITGADDGAALDRPPFVLYGQTGAVEFVRTPRVGITRATELPWRYVEPGSRFLSRGAAPVRARRRSA
jgi:DNA-3-methyladenine glycosylase